MLTEYDIQRLSTAICDKLCNDDKFARHMAKLMQKNDSHKMVNSTRAAQILGISRKSVTQIAEYLNGVRGKGNSAHWLFPADGLIEAYLKYKQQE